MKYLFEYTKPDLHYTILSNLKDVQIACLYYQIYVITPPPLTSSFGTQQPCYFVVASSTSNMKRCPAIVVNGVHRDVRHRY